MVGSEQFLDGGGERAVRLCVQTFGRSTDPAILLIHGAGASMLWWEEPLCLRLATAGRFVIRYDQRDTGRSASFPLGEPGYGLRDLAADAVAVLDGLGVTQAHVVGRSMSGGTALILGVDHGDRVASLTFVSTTTGDRELPGPTAEFLAATDVAVPDLNDAPAVVDHSVHMIHAYYGRSPHWNEAQVRSLAEIDIARTVDLAAALGNHFAIDFDGPAGGGFADLTVPTLVVHGELDPCFPIEHGRALQLAIPHAKLLVLSGSGHEVAPPSWDEFTAALIAHTAS